MSTDYDTPRKNEDELANEPLQALKDTRPTAQSTVVDETETAEDFVLPGADLSGEELTVQVVPAQTDEFTCASCFLVRHRSQIVRQDNLHRYCTDCEA